MLSTSLSSSSVSTPPLHENAMLKEAFNTYKMHNCKWSNKTTSLSIDIEEYSWIIWLNNFIFNRYRRVQLNHMILKFDTWLNLKCKRHRHINVVGLTIKSKASSCNLYNYSTLLSKPIILLFSNLIKHNVYHHKQWSNVMMCITLRQLSSFKVKIRRVQHFCKKQI
jgi:hypothetical protein